MIDIPKVGVGEEVKVLLTSTDAPQYSTTVMESYGPEALAGHLQGEFGPEVKIDHVDLRLNGTVEGVTHSLVADGVHINGISVKIGSLQQLDDLMRTQRIAKQQQAQPILNVLGGVVPTFAYKQILEKYPETIVALGEGEETLAALVRVIKGEIELNKVPGIAYFNQGEITVTAQKLPNLRMIHPPARITTGVVLKQGGLIWAESERGCNGHCTFCSRPGFGRKSFSGDIPINQVINEMKRLQLMGVNLVNLADDDFAGDESRALNIAEEKLTRNVTVSFAASIRADHVFRASSSPAEDSWLVSLWTRLKEANLKRVFLGLESGSDTQLKRYGKGITVAENLQAVHRLWQIGIEPVAGYIAIDHQMTLQELEETLTFLVSTGMNRQITNPLSVLRIQAGSSYEKMMAQQGLLGERTEELVFFKARGFKHAGVDVIAEKAEAWVHEMWPVMFGLKGEAAKVIDGQGSPNLLFAKEMLNRFRDLEVNLALDMTKCLLKFGTENTGMAALDDLEAEYKNQRTVLLTHILEIGGQFGLWQNKKLSQEIANLVLQLL